MLTVRLFARLREQLGTGFIELIGPPGGAAWSIDELVEALAGQFGVEWREQLTAPNIILAINHEVADTTAVVHDGDEIAFYPPVTGG